jgi:hypothetical protein
MRGVSNNSCGSSDVSAGVLLLLKMCRHNLHISNAPSARSPGPRSSYRARRSFSLKRPLSANYGLQHTYPVSRLLLTVFCILPLLALTSCTTLPTPAAYAPWSYADLRLLDPADAPQPTHDLLAVYTRQIDQELQIRLDLLDHAARPDYDLYLALDTAPGGTSGLPIDGHASLDWDTLLVIPATGKMQALDASMQPRPGVALSVIRDPVLDTAVISLNQAVFPPVRLQVFLTPSGATTMADQTGPLSSTGQPPAPARTLFAFWNTYPAYTPATALRRWNGAHTGPLGGSHGLSILLNAARRQGIPLALLDLKNPASLSALDYTNSLNLVQDMAERGQLILPDVIPDLLPTNDPALAGLPAQIIAEQRLTARHFGLPSTPFAAAPLTFIPSSSALSLIFARALSPLPTLGDAPETGEILSPTSISSYQNQRLLLIPSDLHQVEQATRDGPSLDVRRSLIETALAAARPGGESLVLPLGGSLPESTWGAAGPAQASFRYILAHPWIQLLDAQGLLALPVAPTTLPGPSTALAPVVQPLSPEQPALSPEQNAALLHALRQAPDNALRQAAWQAYLALFAPVYPAPLELPALRAVYAGQVWSLLTGADWAADPTPQADCAADPDHDGQAECILSSQDFYAQFEIESGALTHLFTLDQGGEGLPTAPRQAHQIIGPSSQFITGLSDASGWDLSRGLAADPGVFAGAFVQPPGPAGSNAAYRAEIIPESKLVFTAPDGSARKIFQLTSDGIQFSLEAAPGTPSLPLSIPLALDPWQRFQPGWAGAYHAITIPQGWQWSLAPGLAVQVISTATPTVQTFNDSRPLLSRSENPDLDYPPAHTLPFPLGLVNLSAPGSYDVQIKVIQTNHPGPTPPANGIFLRHSALIP